MLYVIFPYRICCATSSLSYPKTGNDYSAHLRDLSSLSSRGNPPRVAPTHASPLCFRLCLAFEKNFHVVWFIFSPHLLYFLFALVSFFHFFFFFLRAITVTTLGHVHFPALYENCGNNQRNKQKCFACRWFAQQIARTWPSEIAMATAASTAVAKQGYLIRSKTGIP